MKLTTCILILMNPYLTVDPGERGLRAASSAVLEREATESSPLAVNIDRWVCEFPPARPTAPGCKMYRRSSALAAPGVILQKGWLQVCKCMSERCEESAHSAGAPVVRRSGRGDEGR